MIHAISPIDGRYELKTKGLVPFWSESALIKYRVLIEVKYLIALGRLNIDVFKGISDLHGASLTDWAVNLSDKEINYVKEIEKETKHDVKAVEYLIKKHLEEIKLDFLKEWVHFGLTSQDINHTALPLMLKDSIGEIILPSLNKLVSELKSKVDQYNSVPMLARTHGQPASPTTMGKEIGVFVYRLQEQIKGLKDQTYCAKFGGATGNFNAHYAAFPNIDWSKFGDEYVNSLGLERLQITTQISSYDFEADLFHRLIRIQTILIDLCRDFWTYISLSYFTQKVVEGEVGSSTMPHKVNPIDFENAEGNLGMSNALLSFFAQKLPISRLQRDLTDSTVSRNIGVALAHSLVAFTSLNTGLHKLELNEQILNRDLNDNWSIITEGIQTILRREGFPKPYEALKKLSRGREAITKDLIHEFIDSLEISHDVKKELKALSPDNYLGNSNL